MGLLLNSEMMTAFAAEVEKDLVKEAIRLPFGWKMPTWTGTVKDLQAGLGRVLHPVKGFKEGWRELTPAAEMARAAEQGEKYFTKGMFSPGQHLKGKSRSLVDIAKGKGIVGGKGKGWGSVGARARAGAEELSRRGWTGRGKLTKYLPVGAKPGLAAWTLPFAVPELQEAYGKKVGPTGEGGFGEALGSNIAGTGAFIASSGLGLPAGLGMYMLGSGVGGRLGRIVDRLRGGASLPTAAMAPTPEEASSNLEDIQRYYG